MKEQEKNDTELRQKNIMFINSNIPLGTLILTLVSIDAVLE